MDLSPLATYFATHGLAALDFGSHAASHLAHLTDSLWSWAPLSQNRWNAFMKGFRVALTLITAGLLMYEWRAQKLGEDIPNKGWLGKRSIAIILTVLGFGAYYDFGNPNTRYPDYYHRHEFYHYYLGSKYFEEVGYTRLYECTMIAEVENGRAADIRQREIRDLGVNLIKPVTDTYVFSDPSQCKRHFAPKRWEAFKRDINWFYNSARGSYWEGMQKDHGYNPPPVWTMGGKFFGQFGPADDVYFKVLSMIDIFLQLGAILLIRWAFGWRAMAITAVFWGCNAPANFYWTGGAFIRQDWIFFLVAAFALARKRMFVLSGVALTWSALLRVFPVIIFGGVGMIMLFHCLRQWRKGVPLWSLRAWHPEHRKFIGGCVIAAGTLIPASIVATGGPESYQSFYAHTMKVHNRTPLTNQMGLESMLVHNWQGRMRLARNDNMDDPFEGWKTARLDRFHNALPVFLTIVAILTLWTAWALRRTKFLWMGMALSLPLFMALTNLTCYYYCIYMLAVAVALVRKPLAPVYLAVSGASQLLLHAYYFVDDQFVSISYLFFMLSLMMLYVYSRPFSVERLRAWWQGKPEPKPEQPRLAPTPAE
jgi:hypothetical protein